MTPPVILSVLFGILPGTGTGQAGGEAWRIDHRQLPEISGLVASRRRKGWFWAHNDSGDGAYLYLIDPAHRLRCRFKLQGAKALDWEDLTLGIGPGGRPWIYVADTGRNLFPKQSLPVPKVYAFPEPDPGALAAGLPLPDGGDAPLPVLRGPYVHTLELRFPDRTYPPNIEAVTLSPDGSRLWLFQRRGADPSAMYEVRLFESPPPAAPPWKEDQVLTAHRRGRIRTRASRPHGRLITAAATLGDRKLLAILTYSEILILPLPPGPDSSGRTEFWASPKILRRIPLPPMPQAEALAYVEEKGILCAASEGRPVLFRTFPLEEREKVDRKREAPRGKGPESKKEPEQGSRGSPRGGRKR